MRDLPKATIYICKLLVGQCQRRNNYFASNRLSVSHRGAACNAAETASYVNVCQFACARGTIETLLELMSSVVDRETHRLRGKRCWGLRVSSPQVAH